MVLFLLRIIVRFLLWLRYRVEIKGLAACRAKGTRGILFLPNHPALIDPVILSAHLLRDFKPRALADEKQIRHSPLKYLHHKLRLLALPDIGIAGKVGHELVLRQIEACVEALHAGDSLLLYPAGRIYRSRQEKLRGNGAVQRILELYPEVRIVLVRTTGLWGSDFSRAKGYQLPFLDILKCHAKHLLMSLLVFGPRRKVSIELVDLPDDFPRHEGKEAINRYLENFYNQEARPNTYVPYTWFERGGIRELPEPDAFNSAEKTGHIPAAVRDKVIAKLQELTPRKIIRDTDTLGTELGLDSLMIAELHSWLQDEFACEVSSPETLRTVASLLLAANGESAGAEPLKPIPPSWFIPADNRLLTVATGKTITEIFLKVAAEVPDRPIFADQARGVFTFRKSILAILVLRRHLAALPGERIGIVMPASAMATLIYLTALFAGKVPVLINWTVGLRNMRHCLNHAGVQKIVTAAIVIERLKGKGVEFGEFEQQFVFLEDIAATVSSREKIGALLQSRFCWRALRQAAVPEVAAILFTSGSENLPKAVPLTHTNIIADLTSAIARLDFRKDDCILGMLPPFHSFGLLLNVALPACTGMRIAYHANPTESEMLARLIAGYKATLAVGTPTFIGNIMRNALPSQMTSVKYAVTGAEKCSEAVYNLMREKCPGAIILEGYGITECGPVVSVNTPAQRKSGTIGQPIDCVEWVITDEACQSRLPTGATGMLLVRGVNVFSGYLNFDGPSPFVEFDGKTWYKTGDLVSVDPEMFLTFRGRLKRFVKIGGEMISLPAIEEILLNAFRRPEHEAMPLAVEAPGDDHNVSITLFTTIALEREQANLALREAGLSPINFIKEVIQINEIPMLGSGKTDYRSLKKHTAATPA